MTGLVEPNELHAAFHIFALYHFSASHNVCFLFNDDDEQLLGTVIRVAKIVYPGTVFVCGTGFEHISAHAARNGVQNMTCLDESVLRTPPQCICCIVSDTRKRQVTVHAQYMWNMATAVRGAASVWEPLPNLLIHTGNPLLTKRLCTSVGFSELVLGHRGTMRAVRDYARFLKRVMGLKTHLFVPLKPQSYSSNRDLPPDPPEKFEQIKADFDVVVQYEAGLNSALETHAVDALIALRGSWNEWSEPNPYTVITTFPLRKLGVHCVFEGNTVYPDGIHGCMPASAVISACVPSPAKPLPIVPHIVLLPEPSADLRSSFGIPDGAFVVGRHGGWETFDIPFVWEAITEALEKRGNLYFLFMNTRIPEHMMQHTRIKVAPATADKQCVSNFVNACSIMLHARILGETFGLACAEFAYFGKPVLAFSNAPKDACNHFTMLKDDGLAVYKTQEDLVKLLTMIPSAVVSPATRNFVRSSYNPWAVMAAYVKTFLPCYQ